MMKNCLPLFLFLCLACGVQAQQKDTLFVADYGIHPYSYENQTVRMQSVIDDCKKFNTKVLVFEKGRYDFWPEGAVRKEYFITNTSTEQECPSKMKTIGLFFEEVEGLTIEGNDATLMFHGKMTMLAMAHCRQMTLKNLHLDAERPGGSELTYTRVDGQGVEVSFHRDSRYEIADGKIHLYGEGWRSNRIHCIEYDPQSEHFFYSQGWNQLAASEAKEVAPGIVRFATPADFRPKVGNTLTMRDIIRDQVGMFIYESGDVTLDRIGMHYMHGLGIVSQYSRNLTMHKVDCTPRERSGRILASSADFMHFSGCSGKINIFDCRYAGAHDDPINVHGTNLRAVRKINEQTLELRFMHGQSYGFNAYFEGDTVAFVKASTMERFASATVKSVKRLTDRTLEVAFDRAVPDGLELNHDCVENMSCTPEVEIRRCYFTRTSTRGTLMTTPRKVVIADNTYYKTGMSAILIEGDAEGWYESGPVRDILIQNNTFIDCAYNGGPGNAVIALHPSNTVVDANRPVHRNVRIIGNKFQTWGNPVLYAKSTEGLVFKDNEVEPVAGREVLSKEQFILNGCKNVELRNNIFVAPLSKDAVRFENMKKKYKK
ncbi:MAG: right-handed parallel beta-helix repeat-containing protein [Phocaeicola sp.]|uniref:right-handed parallel beta-helix repeat-containing protein n=1 Tax=Phocaeicola sp. TaxID=2773926 RepID=UPI0023BFF2D9|nr:right-handed parallel beta-helix repeat-containing protein [Phocaeicola sp.]MDE5678499.1 right-handed parallel beta-helix repeat-containing protein [Phocaeicola sp.]MDE6180156.1 right-handed parallel beta-helix repeat-containing protein [Phocaeicola sp.]